MKVVYIILDKKLFSGTPLVLLNEDIYSKGKKQSVLADNWYFESEGLAEVYAKAKYGEDFMDYVIIVPVQSREEFVRESMKHRKII